MSWFQFSLGDFSLSFLSVILEGVPFLLLGSVLSGIVDVWVSPATVARIVPKNRVLSVLTGGLLGLVFPMCECGSVVVIRRFLKKGLPLGTAVSYMLAAPIVSPIVAFSTWAAFRGQHAGMMTASRLLLGFIIAAATGLLLQKLRPDSILQPSVLPNASSLTSVRPHHRLRTQLRLRRNGRNPHARNRHRRTTLPRSTPHGRQRLPRCHLLLRHRHPRHLPPRNRR